MVDFEIPDDLIEQINRGDCLLFVGAGIAERARGQHGLPSQAEIVSTTE